MNTNPNPPHPKRRIAFIALTVAFIAAAWLLLSSGSSSDGPVYQGKTARQWFRDFHLASQLEVIPPNRAFENMGTNALPFLVHELQRNDSAWEKFYAWLYLKLPPFARKHLSVPMDKYFRWSLASSLLRDFAGKAATPDLLRLLPVEDTTKQFYILYTLEHLVGPADTNCIPMLISCLQSTNGQVSTEAITVLKKIGPDKRAVPALTNLINSNNSRGS